MDSSETPPLGSKDTKTASDIAGELLEKKVADITDGFPAKNAQQLWEIMLQLSHKGVLRIPVASVDGRVFMLFNPTKGEHQELFASLPTFHSVDFTTSIEGFVTDPPVGEDYLELSGVTSPLVAGTPSVTAYLPLGKGTDIVMFYGKSPMATQFTPHGKDVMEKIFTAIPGVKLPRQSRFAVPS